MQHFIGPFLDCKPRGIQITLHPLINTPIHVEAFYLAWLGGLGEFSGSLAHAVQICATFTPLLMLKLIGFEVIHWYI